MKWVFPHTNATLRFWTLEFPTGAMALVAAETLYKLGSFGLELLAFLATWVALQATAKAALHVAPGLRDRARFTKARAANSSRSESAAPAP